MKNGFSILEVLVSIAIMAVIIAVVVLPLSKNRQYRVLLQSTEDIVSALNLSRSNTLSSVGSDSYGVKILSDKVIMFKGSTYNASSVDNKTINLQSGLNVSVIILNGGASEVVFKRLTGATDQYGTITIQVTSDTSKNKTITIGKTGLVTTN